MGMYVFLFFVSRGSIVAAAAEIDRPRVWHYYRNIRGSIMDDRHTTHDSDIPKRYYCGYLDFFFSSIWYIMLLQRIKFTVPRSLRRWFVLSIPHTPHTRPNIFPASAAQHTKPYTIMTHVPRPSFTPSSYYYEYTTITMILQSNNSRSSWVWVWRFDEY